MNKPNLFILGAPKCGTTSLASWLREHPDVFMSPIKEPCYFDKDHNYSAVGDDIVKYESLYNGANKKHSVIGEASVRYIYSTVAVENILDYNPESKFVVCLRNPVDMVQSFYQQQIFSGHEDVQSFEKAWALIGERKKGENIPQICDQPFVLYYDDICSLGTQCERLLDKVCRKKVFFIVLDDLKNDPLEVYKKLLRFLCLKYDGRTSFEPENTSKMYRFKLAQSLFNFVGSIKRKLGIYYRFNTGIGKLNIRKVKREPLSKEMRYELEQYFESEILKLESVLGRDLSFWFQQLKTR